MSKNAQLVVVDPEFAALIPKSRPDELAGLEESLLAEGCRDALVVWRKNGTSILMDGHNRKPICERHGIPFTTTALEFSTRDEARLWILRNQANRRNLSDDQRAMVMDEIIEQQSVVVRARQLAAARSAKAAKASGGASVLDASSKTERAPINTRAELSAQYQLSQRKAKHARLLRTEDPQAAKAVKAGTMLMADAVRAVKKRQMIEQLESIQAMQAKEVEGTFDVIVADPAWPTDKIQRNCRPMDVQLPYPVAKAVAEIASLVGEMLEKHAEPNCHVFIWTTNRFLPHAIKLVEQWGLHYCLPFTWEKVTKNGKPVGMKVFDLPFQNSELCVYARAGNPKFISTKGFYTAFQGLWRGHSVKPREFYEMIARVTGGRRLDMFARERHEGFVPWGKEAPCAVPEPSSHPVAEETRPN
jgi:N6-adenosine-specific RNA methylase IME4